MIFNHCLPKGYNLELGVYAESLIIDFDSMIVIFEVLDELCRIALEGRGGLKSIVMELLRTTKLGME